MFDDGIKYEEMQDAKEKLNKEKALEEYRTALDTLAENRRAVRESEKIESKKPVATSKGPEQSEDVQGFQSTVQKLQKDKVKQDLLDQIASDRDRSAQMRALERETDMRGVADALQREMEEGNRAKDKDLTTKEKNARVWIEQSNMNYRNKEIEQIFA